MRGFQPKLLVPAIRNAKLAVRAHLRILLPSPTTFLVILACAALTSAQDEVELTVDPSTVELEIPAASLGGPMETPHSL